ncbi:MULTISPECIES: hypothetical protein [Brevibacterium]|uniref:DUF4245 domain-containing protein n=1 Tax=Brevibacterium paucivorans TaxID=170994 RepID=A0A2N6VLH0_9MICO|nr:MULTISPECIES: hypothetical protein [Brevibacterium]MCG7297551.1 hypothetical protein [Brevibacterium sp. ACRRH]PMD05002.1 hypothetical protein CJ199_07850 [Brevibacterium paucivorans]
MKTQVFKLIALSTIVALLSSCGIGNAGVTDEPDSNEQRISEGRISVVVPKQWSKNPDFKPTLTGFTGSWANSLEEPTDLVRMSSDHGKGPTAEATMGYFETNAQFRSTYGREFKLGESKDLDIENASQAKLTTWTTNEKTGRTVQGAWVFVSTEKDNAVAGVEIMALTLSNDEINAIIDSIEFDPSK